MVECLICGVWWLGLGFEGWGLGFGIGVSSVVFGGWVWGVRCAVRGLRFESGGLLVTIVTTEDAFRMSASSNICDPGPLKHPNQLDEPRRLNQQLAT